jgi:hypothetical protein
MFPKLHIADDLRGLIHVARVSNGRRDAFVGTDHKSTQHSALSQTRALNTVSGEQAFQVVIARCSLLIAHNWRCAG